VTEALAKTATAVHPVTGLHPLSTAVAVVTGASRGIGRAIATELGQRGAAVVVAARGGADLDDTSPTESEVTR
jgi:NAD(P)-dependent dehydrogenase (short-subunit alcohol dehydrogenase family)